MRASAVLLLTSREEMPSASTGATAVEKGRRIIWVGMYKGPASGTSTVFSSSGGSGAVAGSGEGCGAATAGGACRAAGAAVGDGRFTVSSWSTGSDWEVKT